MFPFSLVLFREHLFEPTRLLLSGGRIDERGVMKNHKFFATAVAAESAHLLESGLALSELPLSDCYRLHVSLLPDSWKLIDPTPLVYRWRSRNDSQLPSAVQPPSTTNVCPFTKPLALSSARNRIASAMSMGEANRPMGIRSVMSASV